MTEIVVTERDVSDEMFVSVGNFQPMGALNLPQIDQSSASKPTRFHLLDGGGGYCGGGPLPAHSDVEPWLQVALLTLLGNFKVF